MIPKNITREHVLKVIEQIDKQGFPPNRDSTRFNLNHNGNTYPPKYVISMANTFANGYELKEFSGGDATNSFLSYLGFNISRKKVEGAMEKSNYNGFSFKSHSWTITSPSTAIKELDKSTFLHHGTGVPIDIRKFFNADDMVTGEKRVVNLKYENQNYSANVEMDRQPKPRTRLLWKSGFSNALRDKFPDYFDAFCNEVDESFEKRMMEFEKLVGQENTYSVSFIYPIDIQTLEHDIQADLIENDVHRIEGTVSYYYGKRYERDPKNRKRALNLHGLSCMVCGFNFEKVYGERGKDYIEVHHLKPLSSLNGKEVIIHPETDLAPVCSNCHRMIHRRPNEILSIEQMKNIIKKTY